MPKGVEHQIAEAATSNINTVPLAVMPKGVEHRVLGDDDVANADGVPLAVMPKGVEHQVLNTQAVELVVLGPARRDAERR